MRERGSEQLHIFIPFSIPYELAGGQFRLQRRSTERRNLLPRTKSAPVHGEKGVWKDTYYLLREKNGLNQPVPSDSNFSSRLGSNLTPRLIYVTTDLTACTCLPNILSLAKGSSEDGVTELMTVSGEYIHVP